MPELTTYHATDRRVYYGAPCDDMARERNHTANLERVMVELDPTTSCTYFPMEGKFLVFKNSNMLENPNLIGPPVELTGVFHIDKQSALIEAIEVLTHILPKETNYEFA